MSKILKRKNGIKIFKRFLKENGVYSAFFREAKKNTFSESTLVRRFKGNINELFEYLKDTPEEIIDRALHWRDTEQGAAFWDDISDKFRDFLDCRIANDTR